MTKKATAGKGRKKRRRAAGFLVSENMQTAEMTFSDGNQFDAGYVKRELVPHCDPEPLEYREKYRAVTPSRRITAVLPIPDDDDAGKPEERSPSWIKRMTKSQHPKKD